MKKLILISMLAVLTSFQPAFAQVSVPQVFVDQADKAFLEVAKDREVIAAKDQTVAAKNETIAAKDASHASDLTLIAQLQQDIKNRDTKIAELSLLKCDVTSFLVIFKIKRCH